jgi:hypothetical protein
MGLIHLIGHFCPHHKDDIAGWFLLSIRPAACFSHRSGAVSVLNEGSVGIYGDLPEQISAFPK